VIKSAMANAEDRRDPRPDYLVLEEVRVDRGPMFRRLRPKARGMATLIKKRMSHITVVLSSRD
jgi:large subunit ribosomal protein L22